MRWIKHGSLALGVVVALVGLVFALGSFVPVGHRASVSTRLDAPPARVWELISDYESGPTWRRDVRSVETLAGTSDAVLYREDRTTGPLTMRVTESVPRRRLVTEIADEGLPFGGRWTFELSDAEPGTRLTITEDGEIYSPLFRSLSRFVFGYTSTLESYVSDLAAALGGRRDDRVPLDARTVEGRAGYPRSWVAGCPSSRTHSKLE